MIIRQTVAEEVTMSQMANIRKNVSSDNILILIDAEGLSLDDNFMMHEPRTEKEKKLKALIAKSIEKGVKNFYRTVMDPFFTSNGIDYIAGKKPAVGKSYFWWVNIAKKYDASRNSRLGTLLEYCAFLGVLIKKLIEEGKSVEWAWNLVCNDSKELGHYWNSENAKHDFEPTGSRCICGFYDLANTYKIFAEDEENGGFWLAGGDYNTFSARRSLATCTCLSNRNNDDYYRVGWLVLS